MSIKIISVAKTLPKYVKETKEIIPFVKKWMHSQESRFQRKVLKLFEGAGVDKRYSIMDADEVFLNSSFEEKNDIYFYLVFRFSAIISNACFIFSIFDLYILISFSTLEYW